MLSQAGFKSRSHPLRDSWSSLKLSFENECDVILSVEGEVHKVF